MTVWLQYQADELLISTVSRLCYEGPKVSSRERTQRSQVGLQAAQPSLQRNQSV